MSKEIHSIKIPDATVGKVLVTEATNKGYAFKAISMSMIDVVKNPLNGEALVYKDNKWQLVNIFTEAEQETFVNTVFDQVAGKITKLKETMIPDSVANQNMNLSAAAYNQARDSRINMYAGSGVIDYGLTSFHDDTTQFMEGLLVRKSTASNGFIQMGASSSGSSIIRTGMAVYPILNINGHMIHYAYTNNVNHENVIPASPAPKSASILNRSDLVLVEVWEERVTDTNAVFLFGNVQSKVASWNGLTFGPNTFTGSNYYSLFGAWQTDGALIGNSLKWSTLTDSQQMTFVSDSRNNCFKKGSVWYQVRYRTRVINGLGGSWKTVEASTSFNLQYNASNHVAAIGKKKAATVDFVASTSTATYESTSFGTPTGISALVDIPVDGTVFGVKRPEYSSNGVVCALPLGMMDRLNDGIFVPGINSNGTARCSDNKTWIDSAKVPTTLDECFASDRISGLGKSGRPDGRDSGFFQFNDFRRSAKRISPAAVAEEAFNAVIDNNYTFGGNQTQTINCKKVDGHTLNVTDASDANNVVWRLYDASGVLVKNVVPDETIVVNGYASDVIKVSSPTALNYITLRGGYANNRPVGFLDLKYDLVATVRDKSAGNRVKISMINQVSEENSITVHGQLATSLDATDKVVTDPGAFFTTGETGKEVNIIILSARCLSKDDVHMVLHDGKILTQSTAASTASKIADVGEHGDKYAYIEDVNAIVVNKTSVDMVTKKTQIFFDAIAGSVAGYPSTYSTSRNIYKLIYNTNNVVADAHLLNMIDEKSNLEAMQKLITNKTTVSTRPMESELLGLKRIKSNILTCEVPTVSTSNKVIACRLLDFSGYKYLQLIDGKSDSTFNIARAEKLIPLKYY